MKSQTLLVTLAVASLCSVANGSITSASWHGDGDGAVQCSCAFAPASATLSMTGDQYWGPGHMNGSITTSSPQDPTLKLDSSVNNDTSFSWTSYQVNVYFSSLFTLPSVNVSAPSGWSVASVSQPVTPLSTGPYAGDYEGTILYSGMPAIGIGQSIDFSYDMTFNGFTSFSFTQEMIPAGAVPESGSFGLIGSLALCAFAAGSRLRGWKGFGNTMQS